MLVTSANGGSPGARRAAYPGLGLLHADAAVTADLSLPVVLRRIVDAARELVGARYAALGVLGRDGQLEQFVYAGMADDLLARIGGPPRGGGSWAC
jgi:hypothetical protein